MGHATLWPVPRAIDAEAHHYPRHWKRNFFLIYGAGSLIFLQISRFGHICRQSSMANGEYMDWGSRHAPMRVRYNWAVVSDQINATYHCLFNFKIYYLKHSEFVFYYLFGVLQEKNKILQNIPKCLKNGLFKH